MFFNVTSANRHSARKLLTKYGHDSTAVRNFRNGQLGKQIYEDVKNGKIPMDEAAQACALDAKNGATIEHEPAEQQDPTTPALPSPAMPMQIQVAIPEQSTEDTQPMQVQSETIGAANQMAAILENLMAKAAPKQQLDADAVRDIVKEILKTEGARSTLTIEIKTNETITKVDGQQHVAFEDVLKTVTTTKQGRRLHAWLVGPSGSGKSFLASQVAKAINLAYYSTSAIQSKYDLIGFVPPAYTGKLEECPALLTPFRRAFQFGGVFAWDDIDASDPRAFVAFNEALSNGRFSFPDATVEQHADFVCIASANTWGTGATADYVGRNKIDAATLSRFVRIPVEYDEDMERELVGGHEWARFVQRVREAVKEEGIKVLITPRHTIDGYALLQAGMKREKVESYTIFAGLDAATVARLRRAA